MTSDSLKRERAQVAVDLLAIWGRDGMTLDEQAQLVASFTHCSTAQAKKRLHYARSQGIQPSKE